LLSAITQFPLLPLASVGTGGPVSDHAVRLDLKSHQRSMPIGLLPDGDFEMLRIDPLTKARTLRAGNPVLAPWRITSGSVNVQTYWPAAEGTHTLDLNGVSLGSIEQSFATIPGQAYQLAFDYGNNPDARARTAGATVTVTGAGTRLSQQIAHAGSRPLRMRYTRFSGTFLADSATTTLRFASTTPGAFGIVLDAVAVTAVPGVADTTPPVIQLTTAAPAGPVSQNVTFVGRVTDDGTGVARLEAQVDSGPFQPVALDSLGQFTFTTALATDGTADGVHVVGFRAFDRAGNVSPVTTETFTLITYTPYTLTDLGTLPGFAYSRGTGVNSSGQVAGSSFTEGGTYHAFLSGPGGGALKDLGTLGGTWSEGFAVNASGQVAGSSLTAGGAEHAFLSGPDGGPLQDLGTLPGEAFSFGNAVNDSGQVAGDSGTAFGPEYAFLSGPGGGALKDLGNLPGWDVSIPTDVNASGQVAGYSVLIRSAVSHAFLSGPGGGPLKDLGTLGGTSSGGLAVNASGQVAGYSLTAGGVYHAFLSGPGGGPLKDLGTLPGFTSSTGLGVNDFGQVVGDLGAAGGGVPHAFLYSGGQMLDLNDLIAPGSGFTLVEAQGISDTGYITGDGTAPNGQTHAFLLTPLALAPVTRVTAVPNSSRAITAILLGFNEALDPGTAGNGDSYSLTAGIKRHHQLVFSSGVKTRSVSYDSITHAVRLKLAAPQKRPVRVTVRAGLKAADGMTSFSDFTAVVM
jgi:choice-of-anchor C domain-containing protein